VSASSDKAQQAIANYLEALLQDVPATPAPKEITVIEKPVKVVGLEQLIAEVRVAEEVPIKEAVVAPPAVAKPVVVEPVLETITAPEVKTSAAEVSPVPDWAAQPFQCLLFKVSGLTLAVPLLKLNSVMPWTDNITQTPNKTSWYLGLVQSHGANVKVIDTALMVLPENRRASLDLNPSHRFSHILLVDNYNWGLACDAIGDVIWLDQHKVKWRKNKTQRPWLAGTALEQLCAIMDTEVFAEMMNANVSGR
jgi:purine-binding chemotaxis protein CheW